MYDKKNNCQTVTKISIPVRLSIYFLPAKAKTVHHEHFFTCLTNINANSPVFIQNAFIHLCSLLFPLIMDFKTF